MRSRGEFPRRRSSLLAIALFAALTVFFAISQITSAQTTSRTHVRVPDDTPDPSLVAARAAMDHSNFTEAVKSYKEYLAKKPNDSDAHFDLGNAYASLKQSADAQAEYEKAISLDPKLDAAYVNLGITQMDSDLNAAIAAFQKAVELVPDRSRPRFLLGWAYERSGKLPLAIDSYRAAVKLDDKDSDAHFALGRALLTTDQPADAEIEFRAAVVANASNDQAYLGLSQSLMAQKKYDSAAAVLTKYLEQQPADSQSRIALALALTKMDKNDEAIAELDRAAAAGPETLSSLKLRSQILFQMKRYDDAIPVLQKAAALAPQDPDAPARLGHLYLEKHAYPEAARALLIAFKMNPNSNDVLGELVEAEYLGKNYEAALKALDLLSQRRELPAGTVFIRATCYDRLGQAQAALDAYQKFLRLNKDENNDMYFSATARVRFLIREIKEKKK